MKVKAAISKALRFITNSPTRVIVLSFAIAIFVGGFLLSLPISHNSGQWFNFGDALFTATSAICVTGLVVVDTAVQFNFFGQLIIIILIQLGGLGVMTGTTIIAVMIGKKITLKNRLYIQESYGENRLQGIIKMIRQIILFTFAVELVGALILMCSFIPMYGGKGVWPSIFISISAYCNAGFDVLGMLETPLGSLTTLSQNAFVILPIAALIVIGGLGVMVIRDLTLYRPKKHKLGLHAKIVLSCTTALIVGGWIGFALLEWNNTLSGMSVGGKILSALFQSVSPRTAGFNSIDQAALTPAAYLLTVFLMFVGASPGSTGGGVKTTTFVCMFIVVFATLRGHKDVNIGKAKLNSMMIRKVLTTMTMAVMTILIGVTLIVFAESSKGTGISEIVYETVSAFSTVGLSMGITPSLSAFSKVVLSVIMFIGRIGPLTLGASIIRSARDAGGKIEYTDAKVLIS